VASKGYDTLPASISRLQKCKFYKNGIPFDFTCDGENKLLRSSPLVWELLRSKWGETCFTLQRELLEKTNRLSSFVCLIVVKNPKNECRIPETVTLKASLFIIHWKSYSYTHILAQINLSRNYPIGAAYFSDYCRDLSVICNHNFSPTCTLFIEVNYVFDIAINVIKLYSLKLCMMSIWEFKSSRALRYSILSLTQHFLRLLAESQFSQYIYIYN
jgi:hypothetical protein